MTIEDLDGKISDLLTARLALEDGEMMMPLKKIEIEDLHDDIRDLVNEAIREATR